MACTVFVNCRGVAHETSGGSSTVFPDVCLTPTSGGSVPIPYTNTGKSSDTSEGPNDVTTDGCMPMVKDAKYKVTTGDEPGVDGGIISGVFTDVCEFLAYSFDVKFEGRNVCRLGDALFHNDKNTMG